MEEIDDIMRVYSFKLNASLKALAQGDVDTGNKLRAEVGKLWENYINDETTLKEDA